MLRVASERLAAIRHLEAVGFRCWPARETRFDGAWAVHSTPDHASKRLNCVTPLDPDDVARTDVRVARAIDEFQAQRRVPCFRLSPLAPQQLSDGFDRRGWEILDESAVMVRDLSNSAPAGAMPLLPFRDQSHWLVQGAAIGAFKRSDQQGVDHLLTRVEGNVGLFLLEGDDNIPLATCMAVHFADLVGLFQVATNPNKRRQGLGRSIIASACLWGRQKGARKAWLQVAMANEGALALYRGLGFEEVYRYHYRRMNEAVGS